LQQVGSGPDIWRRASPSPAPRTALRAPAAVLARRSRHRHTRRRWKALLPALAGASLLSTATFLAALTGTARLPALTDVERLIELSGLGLTQVSITGHRFTPDSDIFDAVGLARARTMLSFDAKTAAARIERLPWVERASIERIIPDRLEVRVTERAPFAVWQQGGRAVLIDRAGHVLHAVAATDLPELPRVAGEGAAGEAARLFTLLAKHPALLRQLELAERIGGRRWALRLSGGVKVQLPAGGEAEALARAAWLLGTQARVGEVDLRVASRTLMRELRDGKDEIERALDALATGGI